MTFTSPAWLLLVLPLAAAVWRWPLPTRLLQYLRITILFTLLLALAGWCVRLPQRAGTVIVVADRSLSMPGDTEKQLSELIDLTIKPMRSGDELGVVSFGSTTAIERGPQPGAFPGFVQQVEQDGSRLGEAIDAALTLIPPDAPARLLVISDGRWTGSDPAMMAAKAAARGIPIDHRLLERPLANDAAIARVDAPLQVSPEESFMFTAWVRTPVEQELTVELKRDEVSLGAIRRKFPAGQSRVVFRDRAADVGTLRYTVHLQGSQEDPVPENNRARVLVGVTGTRSVLCVNDGADQQFASLLAAGGLKVSSARPGTLSLDLDRLSDHSAIILENVPAQRIGQRGLQSLATWVNNSGGGLMMTGGRQSFGPGGYFRSPIEPVLPVSMELRREHRKLSMAIVVALDRSGSMSMPAGGGKVKMDLANLGTVQVLELLSDIDEIGVIAVDSAPHTIVELGSAGERKAVARDQILRIESMGGGIFIDEALMAASKMIANANASTRHIILFADAADSEQPGRYRDIVQKLHDAGVTVSVIGLGKETDSDAHLLKDIAALGNGRIFFSSDPAQLPQLFAQDTFVVARSTFVDTATSVKETGALLTVLGQPVGDVPEIGGYNLTYLRPNATLGIVTQDEYKSPVVATWQAGLGRAAVYGGEVNGKFTGPIAKWEKFGELLTSLARWTAGADRPLPPGTVLRQEVIGSDARIVLELDPQRPREWVRSQPGVTTLRGKSGEVPTSEKRTLRWTSADTLEVTVPLSGEATALSTVAIEGLSPVTLSPVCLPYSPEFSSGGNSESGAVALEQLSRSTGGLSRVDVGSIWKDMTIQPRLFSLAPWLLLMAAMLMLVEVIERRTGYLTLIVGGTVNLRLLRRLQSVTVLPDWKSREKRVTPISGVAGADSKSSTSTSPATAESLKSKDSRSQTPSPSPTPTTNITESGSLTDALSQARKQARSRTEGRGE